MAVGDQSLKRTYARQVEIAIPQPNMLCGKSTAVAASVRMTPSCEVDACATHAALLLLNYLYDIASSFFQLATESVRAAVIVVYVTGAGCIVVVVGNMGSHLITSFTN